MRKGRGKRLWRKMRRGGTGGGRGEGRGEGRGGRRGGENAYSIADWNSYADESGRRRSKR